MKTQTRIDTTLFAMIITTLITGLCLSSMGSLMNSQSARADTVAGKASTSKQL